MPPIYGGYQSPYQDGNVAPASPYHYPVPVGAASARQDYAPLSAPSRQYQCLYPQCTIPFSRYADLQRHYSVTHNRQCPAQPSYPGGGASARQEHHLLRTQSARYPCLYPGCSNTGVAFPRYADLQRHLVVTHDRQNLQLVDCDYAGCHRRGEYGFTRKDKMVDHLREVHKVDVPKLTPRRKAATDADNVSDGSPRSSPKHDVSLSPPAGLPPRAETESYQANLGRVGPTSHLFERKVNTPERPRLPKDAVDPHSARTEDEIRVTEKRVAEKTSRGKTKDKMWTETTKDLVIKEAIDQMGYEYEETDDFFIIEYLRYEDVLRLVELTENIRRERRESASLPPLPLAAKILYYGTLPHELPGSVTKGAPESWRAAAGVVSKTDMKSPDPLHTSEGQARRHSSPLKTSGKAPQPALGFTPLDGSERRFYTEPNDPFYTKVTKAIDIVSAPLGKEPKHAAESGLSRLVSIEDLTALLDTKTYFDDLDQIELSVLECCHLRDLFSAPPSGGAVARRTVTTLDPPWRSAEYDTAFNGILHALDTLESNGLCADHVDVFVEDPAREGVVSTVGIPIRDIRRCAQQWLPDQAYDPRNIDDLVEFLKRARRILRLFNIGSNESLLDTSEELKPQTVIDLTCSLLSLSIAASAGSHCSELLGKTWSPSVTALVLEDKYPGNPELCVVRRQVLSCLSGFVGGPVWVFGKSHTGPPKLLSISIIQFARIWGPIYAVPNGGDFRQLLALNTEGGVLHQTAPDATETRPVVNADEVLMHWSATGFPHKGLTVEGAPSGVLVTSSPFPSVLPPFSCQSRLLIGHPGGETLASCVTLATNPTQRDRLTLTTQIAGQGLQHDGRCTLDIDRFAEEHQFMLRVAGTHRGYYVPGEYQASFSAGQYVNAGIQKTWRRRPATTLKTMLLEYCTKPSAQISDILDLTVGLEVSMCTLSARRISLWEALRMAFPKQAPVLEAAYAVEDASTLSCYLSHLKDTGQGIDGTLSCFWPFGSGIPQVLSLSDSLPRWTAMLKDSHDSACFSVASPRCLTYQDVDEYSGKYVRSLCGLRTSTCKSPTLQTTIDLHPAAVGKLPLALRAKIRLEAGTLEVRSLARTGQLAHFAENSVLLNRMSGLMRSFNGHKEYTGRELYDRSRAKVLTLSSICIVDSSMAI